MATQEANATSRELITMLRSSLPSVGGNGESITPHQLTDHISKTEELITNYELKIAKKREAKAMIQNGDGSDEHKQKRTKTIKGEIINMKKMIVTLRKTIEHQRTQLENMMSNDGDQGGAVQHDSDSDESD